jgi:DNA-binding HxlR family transcriptional regulator
MPTVSSNTIITDQDSLRQRANDAELLRAIFRGKWRLRVLQEIARGSVRLGALTRAIPECRKKVIIDTLKSLQDEGLLGRTEYHSRVKRVEYSIRTEVADDLLRVVKTIAPNIERSQDDPGE